MASRLGCSRSDAASILLRVCLFSAGSSVTHRNVARGSASTPRSLEPCNIASITAVAITVLPAPVIAESAKLDLLRSSCQSRRPRRSCLKHPSAASRW